MSKKTAELSHKQQQRGQDEEQCGLCYGIWNTDRQTDITPGGQQSSFDISDPSTD